MSYLVCIHVTLAISGACSACCPAGLTSCYTVTPCSCCYRTVDYIPYLLLVGTVPTRETTSSGFESPRTHAPVVRCHADVQHVQYQSILVHISFHLCLLLKATCCTLTSHVGMVDCSRHNIVSQISSYNIVTVSFATNPWTHEQVVICRVPTHTTLDAAVHCLLFFITPSGPPGVYSACPAGRHLRI